MESKLFKIGMYWRVLYGAIRILVGLTLLEFINIPFTVLLQRIMSHELAEDPADDLFTFTNHFLQIHPLHVTYFLSFYLIFWGIIDIFLSINLLKRKTWAFPASLGLVTFFVLYELYRLTHTHSLILLSIILIDIIIIWVINREYKKVKTIL